MTPKPLTREELLERGTCCNLGCKNCPYKGGAMQDFLNKVGSALFGLFVVVMCMGMVICLIIGTADAVKNGIKYDIMPEPTPAVAADGETVIALVTIASREHEAKLRAERDLQEFRDKAHKVVQQLLDEIQRLKKMVKVRPTGLMAEN